MTRARTGASLTVERVFRVGILLVFVDGIRRRNPGAVVNAVLSLAGTYLPSVFERSFEVETRPWQRAYVYTAMLTHAVGMLGPYDDEWWWDHLTHTHSATIVGGVFHVQSRRRGRDPRPFVLGAVAVAGGCWELLEYASHVVSRWFGVEPVLVHYGRRDTVLDLAFDLLGACLVLAFGDRLLDNFT